MKILIICHFGIYENTARAFRTYELLKKMQEHQYDIDLLVGSEKRLYKKFKLGSSNKNIPTCNKNVKQKKWVFIRKIGSYILNYLSGDMVILKYYGPCKKLIFDKDYDAVLSIGQPFYPHMIAATASISNTAIKIADCGDPFYIKGKHMAPYLAIMQKKIFSQFHYVVVPTVKALPYYVNYIKKDKLVVIPQGVDFSSFKLATYQKNDIPTFGYAGIFYEKLRDPSCFFEYLATIEKNYKFILYTDTTNLFFRKTILPMVNKCKGKVVVYNLVKREQCIYELSMMDFLLNFENESTIQSPSKLIDYGITKRPVLSIKTSSFNPCDLDEFLDGNYSKQLQYDISQFDINIVFKQFYELFQNANIGL